MQRLRIQGHTLGATLLVAGTSIGVGMLGLPVALGPGGFLPAVFFTVLCWLFMLATGLLIVEACSWMPKEANLTTLAHRLLGTPGLIACWILYLFLFTNLMIAHFAGAGQILSQITSGLLPNSGGIIGFAIFLIPVIYLGTKTVDRINTIMMIGLIVSYLAFIYLGVPFIKQSNLARINFASATLSLPIVFTAFGYQSIIPTLMTYLNKDVKKMRFALIAGTSIPLVIYIVWQALILGIVPVEGPEGLIATRNLGQSAVYPLQHILNATNIQRIGEAFALFALTTSFLGISLAYFDFLTDGFHLKKRKLTKIEVSTIVILVPAIITLIYPSIFIESLEIAGGLGVAILLGLMPVLMVWSGRYHHKYAKSHRKLLPGGKLTLAALCLFVLFELAIELFF